MNVSKFLGKVIGIYMILVSIAALINMPQFANMVSDLLNNTSLMYVSGFFTLIIGILLVVSHNIWEWSWRLIITIISWLILLKGASIIFYPQFIDKTSTLFAQNTGFAYGVVIFDLIIGLILISFGFKR